MIVQSLRFGEIEVPEEKVITMERPILGFETLREYCLIEIDDLKPFLWLQSVENPAAAFLVVNPVVFFPEYRIQINSNEIGELCVADVRSVETYVIVTVPEDPRRTSVNLQGPILINTENSRGKQLVLVNSDYRVRHLLLEVLEDDGRKVARKPQPAGV